MDESIDPIEYKIRFQKEHLQWGEYGEFVYSPGGYYVVQESDWWLEFYFDKFINSIKYFFKITSGLFDFFREQKHLQWMKKDDDYRPIDETPENTSVPLKPITSQVVQWKFEDCSPYLNRKTLKIKKSIGNPKQLRSAERVAFESGVLENFRSLKFQKFKDIVILVKNVVFLADSYVLTAQSKWFRQKLFERPTSTWDRFPVIEILDDNVTPEEIEALLVYMYCYTWPTHVMLKVSNDGSGDGSGNSRSSPSKRFFEILTKFGVSLSMEKESDDKVSKLQGLSEPEAILQETCLPGLHSTHFDNSEEVFSNSSEHEQSTHNFLSLVKPVPYKSLKNSKWNLNPETFKYTSSGEMGNEKNSLENLHPDLLAKKNAADKFLQEFQTTSEDYVFTTGAKDSTLQWVKNIS